LFVLIITYLGFSHGIFIFALHHFSRFGRFLIRLAVLSCGLNNSEV
jgi:hypothetical protein